jgi:hydroxymethylpyrimidine/phosphomethylpyrimidine kinase
LVPSLEFLKKIIHQLKQKNEKVRIIWDPILSASAGFDFQHDLSDLEKLLKEIYIVTPNWNEVKILAHNPEADIGAKELAKYTNVYLKGGHNPKARGKDFFYFENKVLSFNPRVKVFFEKHGSGCVFSSALTANLSKGYSSIKACLRSKNYMYTFLNSSSGLLGNHKL